MVLILGLGLFACFIAGLGGMGVAIGAFIEGEPLWGLGLLVAGVILAFGSFAGLVDLDRYEVREDCKSSGEQYFAKAKVIDGKCRYFDEKSGLWLGEDVWLYVNGLDK